MESAHKSGEKYMRQLHLYSPGVIPVHLLKYFPKNDALGKLSE